MVCAEVACKMTLHFSCFGVYCRKPSHDSDLSFSAEPRNSVANFVTWLESFFGSLSCINAGCGATHPHSDSAWPHPIHRIIFLLSMKCRRIFFNVAFNGYPSFSSARLVVRPPVPDDAPTCFC